ncbi:MAG: c-type cytochrome [Acidobacteria bacterium]|nr:c-type cytochrome [Acidobacteriota bacterium]
MLRFQILLLFGASLAHIVVAQEHSYTQGDIAAGGQFYRMNCVGCHGGDGATVSGIDLGRGKFKIAKNDEDLVRIIVNGIPGTGMPSTNTSSARATMIVAYLRTMNEVKGRQSIAAARGNAGRGKVLFEGKGGCIGCHRILGSGGRSGPDLSDVGHLLRPIDIETAILDADDQYPLGTRPVRVIRKSGAAVSGLLVNQDTYSLQLVDQEGSLRSIERSDVKHEGPTPSWMPSYRGKFDAQELADLIAYLMRQKGVQ